MLSNLFTMSLSIVTVKFMHIIKIKVTCKVTPCMKYDKLNLPNSIIAQPIRLTATFGKTLFLWSVVKQVN